MDRLFCLTLTSLRENSSSALPPCCERSTTAFGALMDTCPFAAARVAATRDAIQCVHANGAAVMILVISFRGATSGANPNETKSTFRRAKWLQ